MSADVVDTAREADRIITDIVIGGVADRFPLYDASRELGKGVHWSTVMNGWVAAVWPSLRP